MTLTLREATLSDLEFLVAVDLKDEGCLLPTVSGENLEELAQHRDKIAAFVLDVNQAAWVYEDTEANCLIGMILWRYRNRLQEKFGCSDIFAQLDKNLFPSNGAFCEIFQLWIAPAYRRQGLAYRLKQQAEVESLRRGVKLIYTHTEERHSHVIGMNLKLGYSEVRRGPIWDDVVRVSLIKSLE